MYIIIVGAGDIGTPLIDIATRSGNEVVVIERDAQRADAIAGEHDCLVLNADATSKETLSDAGAGRADAIISTTDQDATNVMICLLAAEFDIPAITSVVHNPEHMNLFRQIDVNTIENPQQLIAGHLYRAVARPAIVDYMRIGDQAEVFEITVTEDAPVAGKTLTEAGKEGILSDDVLIVAIEREDNNKPITPRGQTRIKANDLLTVYSATGANPELTDIFGHYEDRTT
ncbi:potassium channel family protein [Halapricum hydrolyticum]|uniref:TrkA family potassium uptake protein n=1 Tax=Halapricum hydrolyticum TaxID=2979991 RepID=A0AAE3LE34_9EURY|nr:TrkA family potassium uptake protein [Halapricum hydrolyticum]MCU4716499.1 TrkA family potassium uptake protein [Halapricum hydrolyticum]MCU4725896.1 TrkA family potassium uptake protein [Halapricum hydrolyticum]